MINKLNLKIIETLIFFSKKVTVISLKFFIFIINKIRNKKNSISNFKIKMFTFTRIFIYRFSLIYRYKIIYNYNVFLHFLFVFCMCNNVCKNIKQLKCMSININA